LRGLRGKRQEKEAISGWKMKVVACSSLLEVEEEE
jgi:hypothetical protein